VVQWDLQLLDKVQQVAVILAIQPAAAAVRQQQEVLRRLLVQAATAAKAHQLLPLGDLQPLLDRMLQVFIFTPAAGAGELTPAHISPLVVKAAAVLVEHHRPMQLQDRHTQVAAAAVLVNSALVALVEVELLLFDT
jgi:hypothetical protein